MPVATSYPGVYIEEIPSGVHTLTGVATSITAFVGYTARGAVDEAVRIFSFADFERGFGGLAADSDLSYCVRDFFQNGGTDAYIVRTAANARRASVIAGTPAPGPVQTLAISAISEGTWGNNLQVDVDYATINPASLFNFRVTEFITQNGQRVVGRNEVFRNLSMDSLSSGYAVSIINAGSVLVQVTRLATAPYLAAATSLSGVLTFAGLALLPPQYHFYYTLNGQGPFEGVVTVPTPLGGTLATALAAIGNDMLAAMNPGITFAISGGNRLQFTATTGLGHPVEQSSIHFIDAPANTMLQTLLLGLPNGGIETDGAASARPAQTGTSATGVPVAPFPASGTLAIEIRLGTATVVVPSFNVDIWGPPTTVPVPATFDDMIAQINTALAGAATAQPLLAGAFAQRIGDGIRIAPGTLNANHSFVIAGTAGVLLNLNGANARNIGRYAPGVGLTALSQTAGVAGDNGTAPAPGNLTGNAAAKTGMYALEDVDLFNLLVMPDATASTSPGLIAVLTEALAYCKRRRAFMIIDAPNNISTFAQAQTWIPSTPLTSVDGRNAALYFPHLREPDPLKNGVTRTVPVAGAMAGIYARTDAERGVWKAPAGISASAVGATGLDYTLTDGENGVLNPLGLNCLRTFPVIGTVSWGARTARGADVLADEYKYIPVRRLALFLEESLYRGTQWAVFEPNDEPLWAQIRLNLGAFMHTLFAQGAFQGRTPRDAYFVKCDKETTTQNDIDLGRVNIVVGFAPLKPAEFVIIQIQQIAGAIQT